MTIGADFNFRNKLLKSADIGKVSYLRLLMSLPIAYKILNWLIYRGKTYKERQKEIYKKTFFEKKN